MKLWVRVVEARRLRARDLNGSSDPYVRVRIADKKFRTKTVKRSLYPYWGEEFSFEINDLDEDLLIYVMDKDKFFTNDLVGRLQFNVEMVYDSPNKSLGTKWYDLHPKSKKSKRKDCGEILLSVLFSEDNPFLEEISSSNRNPAPRHLDRHADQASESSSVSLSDILGLPIISPSRSSSSTDKEKPYSEVLTPRSTRGNANRMGRSMPGSPETPKFKMHIHNGYESNVKGQHSRSAPGSPETPKFKMQGHNKYETNTTSQHSRSVPGSPETPKFKMHGHNAYESNTKGHHSRSMPGSPETPKFKMHGHNAYESKVKSEYSGSSSSTEAEETTSFITESTSYAQVSMAHPNPILRNGETTSTTKTSRSGPSSSETPKFKMYGDNVYESKRKGQHSDRNFDDTTTSMESKDGVEIPGSPETPEVEMYGHNVYESKTNHQHANSSFDDTMRSMESKDQGAEVPSYLPGGILVDQSYVIASHDMNTLLFSPQSDFTSSLADLKGNKKLQQEPWRFGSDEEILKRTVTYMKAATKRMKAVEAIEEQTYLKANGKVFAVLVSVSTPDAMYGNTFRAETLYCITPGPDLPSREKSTRLVISWRMNFLKSTMMKGMIEGGARKGFKESFEQFTSLLSQNVEPVYMNNLGSRPEIHSEEIYEDKAKTQYPGGVFDDVMRAMEFEDEGVEVPHSLPGGILVDQSYAVSSSYLNTLLFSPESHFPSSLADMKGNKELKQEAWIFGSDREIGKRKVTYMKAATKRMKAVKAIEEQTYLKANGRSFAVLASVSTPDAMYGSTFRAETLYCITPGLDLPSGEKSSRLVISWRMNFLQSTMMKGMIESGARKAFKETFEQFTSLLSQNIRPVDLNDLEPRTEIYVNTFHEKKMKTQYSSSKFDDIMRIMESRDEGVEVPSYLPGGILVDQSYGVSPSDLNVLLFSPESNFTNALADMKGNKELRQEPWSFESDGEVLKRMVTYMKAATKRMKAVKAMEEQRYLKANGTCFAVLVSVSTPDAMYGSSFRAETLYCITPGSDLSSGKESSRLVISWRMNFLQSTMMKGMIENGARKGFKEGFEQFTSLLSQKIDALVLNHSGSRPKIYNNDVHEKKTKTLHSKCQFDELMRSMESKDREVEVPSNLQGGVLVDQLYVVSPSELNNLLFSSDSNFTISLADLKGNKELQQEPWKFGINEESLKRRVTYIKAATKMMKAVKAIEEQTYQKANGEVFMILVSVSTPDAMYGSTFKAETLYCITPGPVLPSGEKTSRLVISWRVNFLQSTMMKGMIEGGARKGFKESFEQFTSLLVQNIRPVDMKDQGLDKEQVLASLYSEKQSDLTLATQYLLDINVVSTAFMGLYIFMHILLSMPRTFQGLEFGRLDLPDSIAEMIVCTILVLQVQRALPMISRFMQARVQQGSDHGVKGQGDGWVLTIALIEGSTLSAVDSTGFSDPYVIFTCNGKTKTSSIKFQNLDPQWNEVFEFDAMDDPPSILHVEVFDFDGPFDEVTSLGHAEINFVKSNISDLADIWIPLQGHLAEEYQSKLHLRIFLDNTKGNNAIKEYLTKVEKEVGKKINVPSPQTNSAFQILFGLPSEEFLINDFTCRLKRTMLLQGRIFLSARIIGFHANLFGNRTTFFFLWEDIEDIQVLSPTLTSMGSPSLIIILWRGKGLDARHGAKKEDEEGRLKFHFHSFVSFSVAHRTIIALWKAKSLSPEQKMRIIEEESEKNDTQTEESGSLLDLGDASMMEVYSSDIHVPVKFFMELFGGGYLDSKVMEKVGCLDYSHTSWELVRPDVYQRQICYKFDKHVSHYGGEATSTQQLSSSKENGWTIEEVLTLHGIPLSDYFTVHCRYQVRDLSKTKSCTVNIFFGIVWHKSTKHQKRLTTNIVSNVVDRLKSMFSLVEQEYIQEY